MQSQNQKINKQKRLRIQKNTNNKKLKRSFQIRSIVHHEKIYTQNVYCRAKSNIYHKINSQTKQNYKSHLQKNQLKMQYFQLHKKQYILKIKIYLQRYNILLLKMKREYSFNKISRLTTGQQDNQSKLQSQPYNTSTKPRDTWTDIRVEQIKKKYDTPSYRKNYSNYGNNQRSKQVLQEAQPNNPYISYRNTLKDKNATHNISKRESKIETAMKGYTNNSEQIQYVPRFSCGSKQNQNFIQKLSQINNSMKIQSRPMPTRQNKQLCKSRQYITNKIDPRVQNIDKINMKIKKILDCLNENQKNCRVGQRNLLNNSIIKRSIISNENQTEQLQQTKIISKQKITYQRQTPKNNLKSSITSNDRFPISHNLQQKTDVNSHSDSTSKWKYQDKYNYPKNTQSFIDINQQIKDADKQKQKIEDQTDSWFQPSKKIQKKSRSRSCLNNFNQQDIKLNSGKKLDDQISKINERIRQFEQEKKKLNIEFKPYNYQLKNNRSSSNLADHKSQRSIKPPLPKQISKLNQLTQRQYTPLGNQIKDKVKSQTSQYFNRHNLDIQKQSYDNAPKYTFDSKTNKSTYEYKLLNRMSSIKNLGITDNFNGKCEAKQKLTTPEFEQKFETNKQIQAPSTCNDKQKYNSYTKQLKIKTEQGIEQRKRKLLQTATVTFSRQTKRLITNLFEQVKLDQELRNAKIWFRDLMASNKWNQLKQEAQKYGVYLQKQKFQISQQEDNPFYSVRASEQNLKILIQKQMNAEKYWEQNISGQFNLKQFEVQKFTNHKVDLEKKGYFVVQDLVRFLNMQTGTFYRNRDLILVFRRLTKLDKLLWEEFLTKLDRCH